MTKESRYALQERKYKAEDDLKKQMEKISDIVSLWQAKALKPEHVIDLKEAAHKATEHFQEITTWNNVLESLKNK